MISTEGILGVFGLPDTSVEKQRKTKYIVMIGEKSEKQDITWNHFQETSQTA